MAMDLEGFLHTEVLGKNDTEFIPIPEGVYTATIVDKGVSFREQEVTRDGELAKIPVADITWVIDDSNGSLKKVTGLSRNTARQSIFLDVSVDGKGNVKIDNGKGKNVQLGRLREALNMNDDKPFTFARLFGKSAKITIKHSLGNERTYVNVKEVTSLRAAR